MVLSRRRRPVRYRLTQEQPDVQTAQEQAPQRPNIILLMTDDVGWGDAGFQGHATLQTPSRVWLAIEQNTELSDLRPNNKCRNYRLRWTHCMNVGVWKLEGDPGLSIYSHRKE